MAFSNDYLEFVLDQLSSFGPLTHKKMFGGVGIYKEGIMFGGIMGGNFHLKVDDESRQDFIDRGMKSFFHNEKSKSLPSYYEVPIEILENRGELMVWADKAYLAALRKKKK